MWYTTAEFQFNIPRSDLCCSNIAKPYLLSLGFSKPLTSVAWIAAPICGTIIQPLIGIWVDSGQRRRRRQKLCIICGTIATVISMNCLAWVKELLAYFIDDHSAASDKHEALVKWSASLLIYVLNASIQPIQLGHRTLLIESCPQNQQATASAWATFMIGIGGITGYIAGCFSWKSLAGLNQFQGVCLVASMALVTTTTLSWRTVLARSPTIPQPLQERHVREQSTDSWVELAREIRSIVPRKTWKVFHTQFWAWMGWFPLIYYSTT
jgi:solute carrier family 45 protein 1/2/4